MLIAVGVALVIALGVLFLIATGHTESRRGRLSRETRRADHSRIHDGVHEPTLMGSGRHGDERAADARRRAHETRGAAEPSATLVQAEPRGLAHREPLAEEERGVTRRQFFNRGILTAVALGVAGFGAASLGFLWPSSGGGGGFGGKINVGSRSDIETAIGNKQPFYNASAKAYIVPYPKEDLSKAKKVYAAAVLASMQQGFVALYQKCPHLGCRVPWCETSQWFECPCHGSKYNRVGEKKGGPAPRGMDRFPLQVSDAAFVVDTGTIILGPPIGTNTTGQGQEGAACA